MTGRRVELVRIEKPVYGGSFLARVDGKAIFVPLTIPGEQVQLRITEDKHSYAKAEVEKLIESAPQRMPPLCPHFGFCGGCQYQHATYEAQLDWKQAILRETLERAGIRVDCKIHVLAADPWHYRNRIRLTLDSSGKPGYRSRHSHEVVPVDQCAIAAPLLMRTATTLAEEFRRCGGPGRGVEFTLFCNKTETELLAEVATPRTVRFPLAELARTVAKGIPELRGLQLVLNMPGATKPRTLDQWGSNALTYHAGGSAYHVVQGAFFQVNRWLLDPLVQAVTQQSSGDLAWDLYAGVGLFALPLTHSFKQVVAVESSATSLASLRKNLRGTCGKAIHADTLEFLRQNRRDSQPDLIVLDPPRNGLGPEATSILGAVAAPSLLYVSCDPATMARDLKALVASGYGVIAITMIDLFPQTMHLETLIHLRRS
jgi:23S rRNA (uracil1939-C5)-methyltransferase